MPSFLRIRIFSIRFFSKVAFFRIFHSFEFLSVLTENLVDSATSFAMDNSQRKITKIAREVAKFAARTLKADGIGTAEFDVLHVIRKNPGIT